jgi:ankyrin repeat protein
MRWASLVLIAGLAWGQKADPDGTTPLHWAVRNNDLAAAQKLLKAGADVKAQNRYEVTPLYLAAQNGSAEMLKVLLKGGADPNASAGLGESALMTAARAGSVEAVKVLLDAGAKVDAREKWHSQTPLMWAAAEGHPEVMQELIRRGADVNARSQANQWERQVTSEPRDKWMPLGSMTPMMYAAREGCVACVRVLIDAKADMNAQDPHGVTSMLMGVINGHYDVAALLADRGADPNLADDTGRAPLFSAVDFNTMPQDNRPSPPHVLDEEVSALQLAEKLIAKGAKVNAQLTKQQPYRAKLDRGADGMLTTGTTPLLRAAKAADIPAMKALMAANADVNLATRAGITPLMAAAGVGTNEADTTGRFKTEEDAIEAMDLLLKAGAKIDAANSSGVTSLHAAAQTGKNKIVEWLLKNGANVNVKNSSGNTPLDAALGKAGGSGGFDGSRKDVHEKTAKLLEQYGGRAGESKAPAAAAGATADDDQ